MYVNWPLNNSGYISKFPYSYNTRTHAGINYCGQHCTLQNYLDIQESRKESVSLASKINV